MKARITAVVALVVASVAVAMGAASTAAADSIVIGGMTSSPTSTGGSIAIVDPCVTRTTSYSGGYMLWGAVRCGETLNRLWTFRDYYYYDRWTSRYVGTGRCWYYTGGGWSSTFWGCEWIA
jgi:hypothetical protein